MSKLTIVPFTKSVDASLTDDTVARGRIGSVTFKMSISPWTVHMEYRGQVAELLAIGAMEACMVPVGRAKGLKRTDSLGGYFRRSITSGGRVHLHRTLLSLDQARKLPGVPSDATHPLIEWLQTHPGQIHVRNNGPWWHYAGTAQALLAAGLIDSADKHIASHRDTMLLNGYLHVLRFSEGRPPIYVDRKRPVLRLVVDNTRERLA